MIADMGWHCHPGVRISIERLGMIMDPAAIARLEEIGGRPLVRTLVALVLEELPSRLERVRAAVASRDAGALGPAAHSLISTTGNFGAFDVSELARQIEIASPSADWDVLVRDAARLALLTQEFLTELEEVRMAFEDGTGG
jgi:HPt (histidine-containing phosphotransfer) domain-containing protein